MKTVADYIKLVEDAMSVNTVSSGAIATREVPMGAVKKRKDGEDQVDEAKKEIASFSNKVGIYAKIQHNTKSGKYHVQNFFKGSHSHAHDSTHDTEDEARAAVASRAPRSTGLGESEANDVENPLAANIGKFPLQSGATAPDVDDEDTDNGHMFHQKQAAQQNYS